MRTRNLALPLTIAGLLALPQSGWTQTFNPGVEAFLGAGAGHYRLDDEDFLDDDERLRDNRSSWKVFAGLDFGRVLAIELGYVDFGEAQDGGASLEADGWTVSGIVSVPLTQNFYPYAKLGRLNWDAERSTALVTRSDSGEDTFYGVGGRFALNPHLDLRIEYERFALDETDLDMASVNLQVRF